MHNIHIEIWCKKCNDTHMELKTYDVWKCPQCGAEVETHLSIRNNKWDHA